MVSLLNENIFFKILNSIFACLIIDISIVFFMIILLSLLFLYYKKLHVFHYLSPFNPDDERLVRKLGQSLVFNFILFYSF